MFLVTSKILSIWDYYLIDEENKMAWCNYLTIPFLSVGLLISLPIDFLTYPIQKYYTNN